MVRGRRHVLIAALVLAGIAPAQAEPERETTVGREAFVCTSWAAWHEYTLASLTAKGGRISHLCPIRLAAKTRVVIVEEDAGYGASEIRYQGKRWFVDNDRLN